MAVSKNTCAIISEVSFLNVLVLSFINIVINEIKIPGHVLFLFHGREAFIERQYPRMFWFNSFINYILSIS